MPFLCTRCSVVEYIFLPVIISKIHWPLLVIMSVNFCSLHRIVPMSKFMRMVVRCGCGRCIGRCATSQITTSVCFILLMLMAYSEVFREYFHLNYLSFFNFKKPPFCQFYKFYKLLARNGYIFHLMSLVL